MHAFDGSGKLNGAFADDELDNAVSPSKEERKLENGNN
jgi:hypothetical protein